MDVAINIPFGVIDHVVNVILIEAVITGPSIREDIRAALHVAAHVDS